MVKIAVIGSGLMGVKIAGEMAYHGHRVKIHDASVNTLNTAFNRIEEDKRQLREDGLLPNRNFVGQILCLSSVEETVADAEFIFEAVPEDMKLKQDLFQKISKCCPRDAVIATNTLRLDISVMMDAVVGRERTLGIRFLYPVYCIPEIEIMPCKYTSGTVVDNVRALMERMGKTLFFRSGGEPLILTEEQREMRKQARIDEIQSQSGFGHRAPLSLPALSHRGNTASTQDAELSANNQEKDCAICMDRPRDTLLCPCHHLITCGECARSLLCRRDGCPICRKEITEVIRVYHS